MPVHTVESIVSGSDCRAQCDAAAFSRSPHSCSSCRLSACSRRTHQTSTRPPTSTPQSKCEVGTRGRWACVERKYADETPTCRGPQGVPQEGAATCSRVCRGHVVSSRHCCTVFDGQERTRCFYFTCNNITMENGNVVHQPCTWTLECRPSNRDNLFVLANARISGPDGGVNDICRLTTVKTMAPLSVNLHKRMVDPLQRAVTPSSWAV